ncbi:MAG: hypothetical protein NT088_02815 [Candidatus Omnitrophica bacterium]|nr:hypothetical protein [Candidatus Omnitrophota bacterium]
MNRSRAQTTAEYAILFAIVVGAFIAMQVYIKRGLQGRIKDVVDARGSGGSVGGNTLTFNTSQYEPYYVQSNAQTQQSSNESEGESLGGGVSKTTNQRTNVTREQQTLSVNSSGQ